MQAVQSAATGRVWTRKRGIGTDKRGIGTDKRGIGTDKRGIGTDKRGIGTDEHGVGTSNPVRRKGHKRRTVLGREEKQENGTSLILANGLIGV
jgi:hypothetical protein